MKNGKGVKQRQAADKCKVQAGESRPVTPDELDDQSHELVNNPLVGNKSRTS